MELGHQTSSEPAANALRMDVDGILDREAVPRPRTPGGRQGIANNLLALNRDQEGQPAPVEALQLCLPVVARWRDHFEGCQRILDIAPVDASHRRAVSPSSRPDHIVRIGLTHVQVITKAWRPRLPAAPTAYRPVAITTAPPDGTDPCASGPSRRDLLWLGGFRLRLRSSSGGTTARLQFDGGAGHGH
jgi:hypothetical protein